MTLDLRFSAALGPQPGGAVALRFGATGAPPVIVDPPAALPRGDLRAAFATAWRGALPVAPAATAARWQGATPMGRQWSSSWAQYGAAGASVGAVWCAAAPLPAVHLAVPWRGTQALGSTAQAPWSQTRPVGRVWQAPWHAAAPSVAPAAVRWRQAQAAAHAARAPWHAGQAAATLTASRFGRAVRHAGGFIAPWRAGQPVESWGGPWAPASIPVGPAVPCYLPPSGGAVVLLFGETLAALALLLFACRHRAIVRVPPQRVYMITNTTALTRVSDGANIPCLGMSLSLDSDSWAWGFSATLPADALTLIEPDASGEPVELDAEINGQHIRVIAESVSRERVFGQASVRVQGRGKTAILDAPYSALTTFDNSGGALTTQQLLDQALPSGWAADYGLTPWLVPAGAWSHQGTPLSAAMTIAAAGGGYVQPHVTADSIQVLPRYPVAPWGWAGLTPDYELPSAVMTREAIEWSTKPVYNRVFVSGTTNGGKLVRVTRAGSAGDLLARLVADPLITHADGGRQHGLAILADVGVQARVSLRLPVLPATGIIVPGKMIRYVDGGVTRLGLSRSISVEVALAQVWQTIGVETHVL